MITFYGEITSKGTDESETVAFSIMCFLTGQIISVWFVPEFVLIFGT